jgi:hypothetical protein
MTVNKELLRETMDAILAKPEMHVQGAWATKTDCGTAYCFAGWACILSGREVDFTLSDSLSIETEYLIGGDYIMDTARDLLGIDHASAGVLFHATNTTSDLKHYVDEIAEHGCVRSAQDPWVQE